MPHSVFLWYSTHYVSRTTLTCGLAEERESIEGALGKPHARITQETTNRSSTASHFNCSLEESLFKFGATQLASRNEAKKKVEPLRLRSVSIPDSCGASCIRVQ